MRTITLLLIGATAVGCSRPADAPVPTIAEPIAQRLHFHTDLKAARAESIRTGKPLAVFSVLGDWNRHC